MKTTTQLVTASFLLGVSTIQAYGETIWEKDSMGVEVYQSQGQFDYEYSGQDFGIENLPNQNDNEEENEDGNNEESSGPESLLFPRTLGSYDYNTTMIGGYYNYFFDGHDFFRTRLGTNITGSADIDETNQLRNQNLNRNDRVKAFEIRSETDDIRRIELDLLLGHGSHSLDSESSSELYFGLGYTNDSFTSNNVQILENTYNLPVDFQQGDYLDNTNQTYSLKVGFDYKSRLFNNVFFNIGGMLKPYMRYDGEFEYKNRNDVLQPLKAEVSGDGWGISVKTGLTFRLAQDLSANLFYEYETNRIDGDADLTYRNLNNIQQASSEDLDELKSSVNNLGLSLRYHY